MKLLLALAFSKQKSADQLHMDSKNNSTCSLSTSRKPSRTFWDFIKTSWRSGCVATGRQGQPKTCKEELRLQTLLQGLKRMPILGRLGSPWHLLPMKAACKSPGCQQVTAGGELAGSREKPPYATGTQREHALVTISCPTCWALPHFHCFTISYIFEVSWLFGSLKDFPDVPMNCRNYRADARLSSLLCTVVS